MDNGKKKYIVYLSILLIFFVTCSIDKNVDPKFVIIENKDNILIPFGAASADPMYLVGNDALSSHENITGTGEPEDPYVIRDLIITNTTGSCIEIIDTNKYIEIINCSLIGYGNSLKGAIHLKNASNVKIYNNSATNSNYGIRIEASKDISIYENEISRGSLSTVTPYSAIYCWNVQNLEINNNTLLNNSYGVHFHTAGYNYNISIYNNSFANNSRAAIDLYNMFLVCISNNTFKNESYSTTTNNYVIYLSNSTNTTITQNSLISRGGIYITNTSHNNTISSNIISIVQPNPSSMNGIDCSNSNNLTITNNTLYNPDLYGIYVSSISSCKIENNSIDRSYYSGIFCTSTNFLNVINNTINNSLSYHGIDVRVSNQVFLFNNTCNNNHRSGFNIENCPNSIIINNIAVRNSDYSSFYLAGINLNNCPNSIIENNTLYNNKKQGICLDTTSNCNLTNNRLYNNEYNGIYLRNADLNNITQNYIFNSTDGTSTSIDDPFGNGIYLDSSYNNKIFNNIFLNNSNNGIYLDYIDSCDIFNNVIKGSANAGIFLDGSSYINIYKNEISFSSVYGIYDLDGYQNRIYQNEIKDNDGIGIYLESCDDFLVYLNIFLRNENDHAFEIDCPENVLMVYWNYYDDYLSRYPTAVVNGSFWSIPYAWSTNTVYDYYPLVNPSVEPPKVPNAPELLNRDGISKFATLELGWDPVVGAQNYLIYIDYEYLTTITATSYIVTLSLGEHYIFITAYNSTGESLWSNIILINQITPSSGDFILNTDWITDWDLKVDVQLKDMPKIWGLADYFYIVWTNDTYGEVETKLVLSKWDYNGLCLWNITYSNDSIRISMGSDIWSDGLYIYTAGTASDYDLNYGILLIKWDLDGNIIKDKFFISEYSREVVAMTGVGNYIFTTGTYYYEDMEFSNYMVETLKWDTTNLEVVNNQLWSVPDEFYHISNAIYADDSMIYIVGYVRAYSSFGFLLVYSMNLVLINESIDFLDSEEYPDYRIQSITSDSSNLYLIGISNDEIIFIRIAKSTGFRTITIIQMNQPMIYSSSIYKGYIWAVGGMRIVDPNVGIVQTAYIFQITPTGLLVNVSFIFDDFFCDYTIHNDKFILTHLYTTLLYGEVLLYHSKIYIFEPPAVYPLGSMLSTPNILTKSQTITEFSIIITWTVVSGASNYEIYVNNMLYNIVSSTSCAIYFAECGDYEIYIIATNLFSESLASNKITIKVREPGPNSEILMGMAAVGGVVGAVASNVVGSQGVGDTLKRRIGRKRKVNFQPESSSSGTITTGEEPMPIESLQSQVGVVAPGDYVGLLDKFRLLWEHMPDSLRKSVFRSLNRFFKFKDEASIELFTAFQNLSNDLFKACTLIREGKVGDAVSMLEKISKESQNKEFFDLANESEQISMIAKSEPQSMTKQTELIEKTEGIIKDGTK